MDPWSELATLAGYRKGTPPALPGWVLGQGSTVKPHPPLSLPVTAEKMPGSCDCKMPGSCDCQFSCYCVLFITSQPRFPHLGKEGKKGLVLGNGWNVLWEAVVKSPEY